MGKSVPMPSLVGDVPLGGYLGVPMAYYINDGKIVIVAPDPGYGGSVGPDRKLERISAALSHDQ
jgi:hypothetical protein